MVEALSENPFLQHVPSSSFADAKYWYKPGVGLLKNNFPQHSVADAVLPASEHVVPTCRAGRRLGEACETLTRTAIKRMSFMVRTSQNQVEMPKSCCRDAPLAPLYIWSAVCSSCLPFLLPFLQWAIDQKCMMVCLE